MSVVIIRKEYDEKNRRILAKMKDCIVYPSFCVDGTMRLCEM